MQTTADLHNRIAKAAFPKAELVLDNVRALDTADGMFHAKQGIKSV